MLARLGPMLAHLGAVLAHLGAMLVHLGAMLAHLGVYVDQAEAILMQNLSKIGGPQNTVNYRGFCRHARSPRVDPCKVPRFTVFFDVVWSFKSMGPKTL